MKFKVAAALGTAALCAAVASCSSGSAATASPQAPPITVLAKGAESGNGDIFLAPQSGGRWHRPGDRQHHRPGALIPRAVGGHVRHRLPHQTYLGKPLLTWFQVSSTGGEGVIYSARYQQIATVKSANGYAPDFHEFLITPWSTALILADKPGTANLTSLGLSAHQQVMDGLVQEIDIKTGKLLFQWVSSDHVSYSDSHAPMPQPGQPWDWFHINAVHLDTDGNLLISSRFTWTICKVNLRTGVDVVAGVQSYEWLLRYDASNYSLQAESDESRSRYTVFSVSHRLPFLQGLRPVLMAAVDGDDGKAPDS